MVWVAFFICIKEEEIVAEKSNLLMTTLYFNHLCTYTHGVAKANQTSRWWVEAGGSFASIIDGPRPQKHFALDIVFF